MGRRVDVSVLQVAVQTWRMMSELQVRLDDLIEVLQRGVVLAEEHEDEPAEVDQVVETPAQDEQRDDRGRKVRVRPSPRITRERDWREPALIWLAEQPQQRTEVRHYAAAFGVSRGCASMRITELVREGKIVRMRHGHIGLAPVGEEVTP